MALLLGQDRSILYWLRVGRGTSWEEKADAFSRNTSCTCRWLLQCHSWRTGGCCADIAHDTGHSVCSTSSGGASIRASPPPLQFTYFVYLFGEPASHPTPLQLLCKRFELLCGLTCRRALFDLRSADPVMLSPSCFGASCLTVGMLASKLTIQCVRCEEVINALWIVNTKISLVLPHKLENPSLPTPFAPGSHKIQDGY